MLPQFKFEGPLIETQVLQSGMDGSQITTTTSQLQWPPLDTLKVSRYFSSYLRCVFMEHEHLSPLYKCSRHCRLRGHIQPQSTWKNFDWIWHHFQMQRERGAITVQQLVPLSPFCTYALFQLSAINLRWAGFQVAGRILEFVLWTVTCSLLQEKKKHCRHGVSHDSYTMILTN